MYLQAVCCPDKEHCCPQGYTCDILSRSCQKLIMMQLERVPLTPVYLLEPEPQLSPTKHKDIKCDEQTNCGHDETCCRTSATSWGCCPSSNVWFTEISPASFLLLYVNCQGELRTVSKPRAPKFFICLPQKREAAPLDCLQARCYFEIGPGKSSFRSADESNFILQPQ